MDNVRFGLRSVAGVPICVTPIGQIVASIAVFQIAPLGVKALPLHEPPSRTAAVAVRPRPVVLPATDAVNAIEEGAFRGTVPLTVITGKEEAAERVSLRVQVTFEPAVNGLGEQFQPVAERERSPTPKGTESVAVTRPE